MCCRSCLSVISIGPNVVTPKVMSAAPRKVIQAFWGISSLFHGSMIFRIAFLLKDVVAWVAYRDDWGMSIFRLPIL